MRFILLFFATINIFFIFFGIQAQSSDKLHVCFFELGNTVSSKNFRLNLDSSSNNSCEPTQKINEQGVVTHCYKPKDNEPAKKAFERMIQNMKQKGKKCDSLVLSGHHTGDWYGRGRVLWLKDMEALSCDPEYKDWFSNIKSLYMDGCNTATDGSIRRSKNPDTETVRVIEIKINRETLSRYQQSYTATLDENTALSSRYLRMFPNTQIYGFKSRAPTGKQVKDHSHVYNHIINVGKALNAEEAQSEANQDLKKNLKRGIEALLSEDGCDEEKLGAWEEEGWYGTEAIENQDYSEAYSMGCDLILAKQILDEPHSPEAQKKLAQKILKDPRYKTKNDMLSFANKILNADISQSDKNNAAVKMAKKAIVETLKSINKEDERVDLKNKYSHILFNNIYDTWNIAQKTTDSKFFQDVRNELQKESFTQSLEKKITSQYVASLKKGDYLKFYTDVHSVDIAKNSKKARFVKKHVKGLLKKVHGVFPDLEKNKKLNMRNRRGLAVSVADQLFEYEFLNETQIKDLIDNQKLFRSIYIQLVFKKN